MSKLRLSMSMSLDGFVAGPNQSEKEPLGVGGEQLHQWLLPLKAFRATHGEEEGGEVNASAPIAEAILGGVGATIMGRNMFGGGPGPWGRSLGAGSGEATRPTITRFSFSPAIPERRSSSMVERHSTSSPTAFNRRSSRPRLPPPEEMSRSAVAPTSCSSTSPPASWTRW